MGCQLLATATAARISRVWAPNARDVSVIGDWNGWQPDVDALSPRWDHSGIWEARRARRCARGQTYKYRVTAS